MPARTKLIQGTFILTFVGILSRFMGFFFRMFTSHIFGEEKCRSLPTDLSGLSFLPFTEYCRDRSCNFTDCCPEGIPWQIY